MSNSRAHLTLFIAAAALGLLALVVDIGEHQEGDFPGRIEAITVAGWLRDRHPTLLIADIRTAEAWDEFHIPRAKSLTVNDLYSWADTVMRGDGRETLVIYDGGDGQAEAARQALSKTGWERAYYLADGVAEWLNEVMGPSLDTTSSTAEELAAFQEIAELSRYFGGTPRLGGPESDDDTATVLRPPRRGCGF
jgi:rhodanese-related sulfurtransferase